MSADLQRIDDLVTAIAEGRAVDLPRLLEACENEADRRLIAQLGVLSEVARTASPATMPAVLVRWGPLEVLEELGRGAFGRVYRARDPRVDREVALKLFDRAAIGDGELVREAQLLARIRHPHVVLVHGAATVEGRVGLWMELVKGRTLYRIVRDEGPFSPREATLVGIDLCRALAAVHGARLVHRDIKTSNVVREVGGRIVLMDFGAGSHIGAGREVTASGTGTPFYMAPELLEGDEASVGSDLYALGVLIFHLITGSYPASGSSVEELREHHRQQSRTLLREARPEVPAALAQVVDRALHPTPEARFRSAADMERGLAASLDVEREWSIDATAPWWRRWTLQARPSVIGLAAISIVASAMLAGIGPRSFFGAGGETSPLETVAFSLEPPEGWNFAFGLDPAVSPDGSRIAFATATKETSSTLPQRLWMRRLDSLTAEPIPNTDGGNRPFWSPDGRFMAFTQKDSSLHRVDVTGGSVTPLADWGLGGTWNNQGVVLFSGRDGRIYRVPQDGGEPVAITEFDVTRGERLHLFPSFLPDGRRFLFLAEGPTAEYVQYAGSLDSPKRTRIANMTSKAQYAAGHLYYQREGTLVAQPFDLETCQLSGEAHPVARSIRTSGEGGAGFSVSGNGVVAYATESAGAEATRLAWFDATGKRLGSIGEASGFGYPTLSPDESRVAMSRLTPERHWDVWTILIVRNVIERFTFNNDVTFWPVVWSTDGRSIIYSLRDNGRYQLYRRSLLGDAKDEPLVLSGDDKQATAISSDGQILLFNSERGKGHGSDTWARPVTGESPAAYPVLEGPQNEESAVFSPDGRWIGYASDESGVFQIYAQPFPPTGANKVQISTDGGAWPRWNRDGRIFYSTTDRLWSVDVSVSGSVLRGGTPKVLFTQRFVGNRFGGFAVDRAGNRFLLIVPDDAASSSIKVLVNPLADIRSRR